MSFFAKPTSKLNLSHELLLESDEEEERFDSMDQEGEESSNCSTPTMMEPRTMARVTITLIIMNAFLSCF